MKCPQCGKEMAVTKRKVSYEPFYHWEDECYYYDRVERVAYKCPCCYISLDMAGNWFIPKFFKPTEKQVNCIAVINAVLGTEFEALTKDQCCRIIAENMERSKAFSKHCNEITDEDCEYLGIDASFFW